MAFSGTISQTVFNTRKVIDRAFGRCKMPAATISSENIAIANDALYLLISSWANLNVPLWCIQRRVYPLYDGVGGLVLDVGTVDVLSANLRQISPATGTEFVTPDTYTVDFIGQVQIAVVGIKWAGPSTPLIFERSDDSINWTVVDTVDPGAVAGEWTWFDIEQIVGAVFFRISTAGPDLEYERIVLGTNPSEIPIARINMDVWADMPNKTSKGRPVQYWLDRQVRQPIMNLWSVPDASFETWQVVLQVHRHIMDVGTMQQEVEVPQRWYDALVAGLALRLANEIAEVDVAHVPRLEAAANKALYDAAQEERDDSPIQMMPNFSAYTR